MSDLVENPEDKFSNDAAHMYRQSGNLHETELLGIFFFSVDSSLILLQQGHPQNLNMPASIFHTIDTWLASLENLLFAYAKT